MADISEGKHAESGSRQKVTGMIEQFGEFEKQMKNSTRVRTAGYSPNLTALVTGFLTPSAATS